MTVDASSFGINGNGTGFGIYRSAAARTAGYTWTIENDISSGGSSASHYQTDDLLFKARADITDTTLTEQMRITSSGNLLFNSGYGSVATAYGVRAWVNFNGTGTVSIYDSGNVSSITDLGSGKYTVNFSTAMTDLNYAVVLGASTDSATTNRILHENNLNRSTASCDVSSCALGGSEQDEDRINVAIIR